MKTTTKLLTLALSLLLSVSCIEMLPDLNPDSPNTNMTVIDINSYLTFDQKQGKFDRTEKFDINGDGKVDLWFIKYEIGCYLPLTSRSIFLAINGEYLASSDMVIASDINSTFPYQALEAIPLRRNQLVGDKVINNAVWAKDGFKFEVLQQINTMPPTTFYRTAGLVHYEPFSCGVRENIDSNSSSGARDYPSDYYIAFRIKVNNKNHYGWINFENTGKVLKVAISKTPEQRVITGQVK